MAIKLATFNHVAKRLWFNYSRVTGETRFAYISWNNDKTPPGGRHCRWKKITFFCLFFHLKQQSCTTFFFALEHTQTLWGEATMPSRIWLALVFFKFGSHLKKKRDQQHEATRWLRLCQHRAAVANSKPKRRFKLTACLNINNNRRIIYRTCLSSAAMPAHVKEKY